MDGNCISPCLNSQTLYFLGGGGAHFFFLQSSSPQGQPIAKSGAGFFTEMSIPVGQRRSQNGRVNDLVVRLRFIRSISICYEYRDSFDPCRYATIFLLVSATRIAKFAAIPSICKSSVTSMQTLTLPTAPPTPSQPFFFCTLSLLAFSFFGQ